MTALPAEPAPTFRGERRSPLGDPATLGAMPSSRPDRVLHITGGHPLRGRVRIGGSKNATLPIMAGALLTRRPVRVRNVARVADTDLMCRILRELGVGVTADRAGTLTVTAADVDGAVADELGRRMRASIVLLGALVGRVG